MPRPKRLFFPGAVYHVTSRGNNKEPIFRNDADRKHYLDLLLECKAKYGCVVYAYVLMGNHVHISLETKGPDLCKVMEHLNYHYTLYFNHKYQRTGHLFGARYYCKIIQKDRYFLAVIRYIHVNPVRAGLCVSPGDYNWSSYKEYIEQKKGSITDFSLGLQVLSALDESAIQIFKEFHKKKITKAEWRALDMQRNCILGNKQFRAYVKKVAATF